VCVTNADNGKKIEVWTGQTLVVRLPSNPTTGYMWEAVGIDKSILQQVGEPELEPQADAAVGAPMTATFRFEVMKNGLTELRMANRRSWQKFKEPADTFVLKLIAH
jgi:inhibitor of cysteine peptidase